MSNDNDSRALNRAMEPVDYLLFRGESDPRTRTAMMSVAWLDAAPDFARLRTAYDRTSRVVLRLRQHVVVPTLPLADPQWIVDPDFDLDYHLRRVSLPAPGTLRQLLDFAQLVLSAPLDTARPLWETYLVEGLGEHGDEAALLMKMNHAVTDGLGGVELARQLFDFEPDVDRGPLPPLPSPEDLSGDDLVRIATRRAPFTVLSTARRTVNQVLRVGDALVRRPEQTMRGVAKMLSSAQRVLGAPPATPSPLLRGRSLGRRLEALEVPLPDLRRASKAVGGSVNDGYISAVCGCLRRYHEALGVQVGALPLALPVSLRTDDDPAGGNRFAGARIAAPVGEPDPAKRIATIRGLVTTAVGEPAINALSAVAPLLVRLPGPLLNSLSTVMTNTDVQASNVPGYPEQPYVAGVKVVKSWPFGPLPGVPMMITMYTQAGICFVGVHYDTASITDGDLFARCLREGFDEVLALDPERVVSEPPKPRRPSRKAAAR